MPSLLLLAFVSAAFTPAAGAAFFAISAGRAGGKENRGTPVVVLLASPALILLYVASLTAAGGGAATLFAVHLAVSGATAGALYAIGRAGRTSYPVAGAADASGWIQDGLTGALLTGGAAAWFIALLGMSSPGAWFFQQTSVATRALETGLATALPGFAAFALRSRAEGPRTVLGWVSAALAFLISFAAAIALLSYSYRLPGAAGIRLFSDPPPFPALLARPSLVIPLFTFLCVPPFLALFVSESAAGGLRPVLARCGAAAALLAAAVVSFWCSSGDVKQLSRRAGAALLRSDSAITRFAGARLTQAGLDPDERYGDDGLMDLAAYRLEQGDAEGARKWLLRVPEGYGESLEHQECVAAAKDEAAALEKNGTATNLVFTAPMPPVSKGEGLNANWRAFLSIVRHYRPQEPEERLQSSLAKLSRDPDKVSLPSLYEFAQMSQAATELGLTPLLTILDKARLISVLQGGDPVAVWLVRPYPHDLVSSAIRQQKGRRSAWTELSSRAVVVAGYRPATDAFVCYDYTLSSAEQSGSEAGDARRIVRGARGDDGSRPVRAVSVELASSVFETRWNDLFRITALFVPDDRVEIVTKTLGMARARLAADTRGIQAFFRSRHYLRAADWLPALQEGRRAQREMPDHLFLSHYNGILQRRLATEAGHATQPDVPGSARDAWRRAKAAGLTSTSSVIASTRSIEKALMTDQLGYFLGCHLLSLLDWGATRGDPWAFRWVRPLCESLSRSCRVNVYFHERQVDAAREDGDLEAESRNLLALLDLVPHDGGYHLALSRALIGLQRTDEAVRQLDELDLPTRMTDAGARHVQGEALRISGHAAAGRNVLREAARLDPMEPRYALSFAAAALQDGDRDAMNEGLDWAERVDPAGPGAREAAEIRRKAQFR